MNKDEKIDHSKKLNLSGLKPDLSKYVIKKNSAIPATRYGSGNWDHLIVKLDKGDAIEMNKKEANSFTNRARNLGYVIVLRRLDGDIFCVWFGGLKK